MQPLIYIDRASKKREREKIYGEPFLQLLYGNSLASRLIGRPIRPLITRLSLFSRLYGWWQRLPITASKVEPFIRAYGIDRSEFLEQSFRSFNDFFIRKLKPTARPIAPGDGVAVMPADGRYLVFENAGRAEPFNIKGQHLDLTSLLKDTSLAQRYSEGGCVMARLCPSDYHRFHFPVHCQASHSRLINGTLYSVNPVALKQNLAILSENKRMLCTLNSRSFGEILFIEVGATNVGSIQQTYTAGKTYDKGTEKGYFAFGGSSLVILFPPGAIRFDEDLLAASREGLEIRCLMGQSLGISAHAS